MLNHYTTKQESCWQKSFAGIPGFLPKYSNDKGKERGKYF